MSGEPKQSKQPTTDEECVEEKRDAKVVGDVAHYGLVAHHELSIRSVAGYLAPEGGGQPSWDVRSDDPEVQSQTVEALREQNKLYAQQQEKALRAQAQLEAEKTRRLWLVLAVASLLVALLIITFAPEGRETLSYWIGGALLIFATGAAGYKRVWSKVPGISVGADQDKRVA